MKNAMRQTWALLVAGVLFSAQAQGQQVPNYRGERQRAGEPA